MDASLHDLPGWPKRSLRGHFSSPALGDLDGDGAPEIVVGSDVGNVYAWRISGEAMDGFPVRLGYRVWASPTMLEGWPDRDPRPLCAAYIGRTRSRRARMAATHARLGRRHRGGRARCGGCHHPADRQEEPRSALRLAPGRHALSLVASGVADRLRFLPGPGGYRPGWARGDHRRRRRRTVARDRPGWARAAGLSHARRQLDRRVSGHRRPRCGWLPGYRGRLLGWAGVCLEPPGRDAARVAHPGGGPRDQLGGPGRSGWRRPPGYRGRLQGHSPVWLDRQGGAAGGIPHGLGDAVHSSPWVGDLEGDGRADIVVGANNGIHVLQNVGTLGRQAWPMFHRDARRSGATP